MTYGAGITRVLMPKGFLASGVNCGVRRYRPDLGIIISDRDCTAVGVFTLNKVKAAPVLYSQALLPSTRVRAVVTNSGQANAVTGAEGVATTLQMAQAAAKAVGCQADQVLTASTGVIGVQMEIDKIVATMPELVERAREVAEPFALAILTTDLVPKTVSVDLELSGGKVQITGICKGSGMIHPNMGTMLGYLLTDVELPTAVAKDLLTHAVDNSFNMVSVDGDTSTNDTVYLLANGASGVKLTSDADLKAFRDALAHVSQELAKAIARDGEGASKLIEVQVKGAPSEKVARVAARAVTLSPLVKTAVHGEDPNWGRILAKVGSQDIPQDCLDRITVSLQGQNLLQNGKPTGFKRDDLRALLRKDTILIEVDFGGGSHSATAWGCDLSKKYIEINAEYTT